MIRPLITTMRALVETMDMETSELIPTQITNPSTVHKRQARTLLSTYPRAPRESGLSHQAMAMPHASIVARFEWEALVVINQMMGAEIKRVMSRPAIQPIAP